MADYILSCCSTADLSEQHFLSRDIHYICFHYMLDGKQYLDDLEKVDCENGKLRCACDQTASLTDASLRSLYEKIKG